MSLIALEEAQNRLFALGRPVEMEDAPLLAAAGRWAAADVIARRSQPALPLSAMDGYAIRFTEQPGPWRVVGESPAGGGLGSALEPGEAARIFTGAPVPDGADTVLLQEDASRDGDSVRMSGDGPGRAGKHIRPAGSDFRAGDVVVAAGERLTPARIALAASAGHAALPVRRPVRIAILSTGDELVPAGEPAEGAMLPASNAPMLAAQLAGLPVIVEDRGIVADRLPLLTRAFAEAAATADILVTTGGVSVGDHDLVRPALEAAGAAIDFWKVRLKPGKPLMAGRLGDAIILGLPGNPVSAFVTAMLFLKPLIAHLGGAGDPRPLRRLVPSGSALPAGGDRLEFIRATTRDGHVHPASDQGSAALAALGASDALIIRPAGALAVTAGALVEVIDIG